MHKLSEDRTPFCQLLYGGNYFLAMGPGRQKHFSCLGDNGHNHYSLFPFFTPEYFLKYFMNPLQENQAALPGPGYSSGKSSMTHSYQYFHVSKQWYMACGSTNTATCITSKGQWNLFYPTTRESKECKGGGGGWSLARNSFTQIWKEWHQKSKLRGGVVFKDMCYFIRSYCSRTFIPKPSKWVTMTVSSWISRHI